MKPLATAFVLLALLPAAAVAKTGLSLNPPPDGLKVGEPWDVSLRYIRNDAAVILPPGTHPLVRIVSEKSGRALSFRAHRVIKEVWAAHVLFPAPGRWDYSVEGMGTPIDEQNWEPVTIADRARAPVPVAAGSIGGDGSSFPYGWVGAGAAALLLAAGLLVVRRRA